MTGGRSSQTPRGSIAIPPQNVAAITAQFSIPPGPQATVLPSWAPTSSDYEALFG